MNNEILRNNLLVREAYIRQNKISANFCYNCTYKISLQKIRIENCSLNCNFADSWSAFFPHNLVYRE